MQRLGEYNGKLIVESVFPPENTNVIWKHPKNGVFEFENGDWVKSKNISFDVKITVNDFLQQKAKELGLPYSENRGDVMLLGFEDAFYPEKDLSSEPEYLNIQDVQEVPTDKYYYTGSTDESIVMFYLDKGAAVDFILGISDGAWAKAVNNTDVYHYIEVNTKIIN